MEQKDLTKAENILKAINKATFNDMQGQEVLALAQSYSWLAGEIAKAKKPPVVEKKPRGKVTRGRKHK